MADPVYRYSVNRHTGNGIQTNWEISFTGGYISKEHVKAVNVDTGNEITFEWVDAYHVQIVPAVPAGTVFEIYRDTPKDLPLVDFADTAIINETVLDLNARQAVFIAAETWDRQEARKGDKGNTGDKGDKGDPGKDADELVRRRAFTALPGQNIFSLGFEIAVDIITVFLNGHLLPPGSYTATQAGVITTAQALNYGDILVVYSFLPGGSSYAYPDLFGTVYLDDFILPGETNHSLGFQRCHDFLRDSGSKVTHIQLSSRWYSLQSAVTISSVGMQFHGRGYNIGPNADAGTVFVIANETFTPFTITRVAESRGTGFMNIAVAQGQPDLVPGWAPKAYPPVFDCQALLGEFFLDGIYGIAVTKLVNSQRSGRLTVKNIRGQFFDYVAKVDDCLDVPHFHHWHIWTFWTSHEYVMQYQQANFQMAIIGRCDSLVVDDIFMFAGHVMWKFEQTAAGIPTKFMAGSIICDFTRYAVWADSPLFTAQIAALNHQGERWEGSGGGVGGLSNAKALRITGADAFVSIGSLQSTDCPGSSVSVEAAGGKVYIGSALWDRINADGGYGACHLTGGSSVFVNHWDIKNSPGTSLTTSGGALVSVPLTQNMPAGAINQVYAAGSAAGGAAQVYAEGQDANIALKLQAKGTAFVEVGNGFKLWEIAVSELPAYQAGVQYFIGDASNTTPGAAVLGGGTNQVLVMGLRGAWRIVI